MVTEKSDEDVKTEEPGKKKSGKAPGTRRDQGPSGRRGGGGSVRRSRAILMMALFFGLGVLLDHFFLYPRMTSFACETAVLLATGSSVGDFTLYDYGDSPVPLSTLTASRVTLIVFEDKDVGSQNGDFKKRFGVLQKTLGERVVLLPVADVSNYNYWPAKRFVKDALRAAGRKDGITVYADWSGAGRTILRPRPKLSNLVLVDPDLKVLWASSGQLKPTEEDELLALVKSAAR